MKKPVNYSVLIIAVSLLPALFLSSCTKEKKSEEQPATLSVDLPELDLQYNLYYLADYNDRIIEMQFSQELDTATVAGNISLSDKNGPLTGRYDLMAVGQRVLVVLKQGFSLEKGWRYLITINTGLKSTSGITFASPCTVEIRTLGWDLGLGAGSSTRRNAILCISDIHMGEERAVTDKYCWFYKNADPLKDLLGHVLSDHVVRQVVIMGDLFDEWIIPYNFQVFDSSAGVTSTSDYFHSVAKSITNKPIIDQLKAIAASDSVELDYIPGNHDMLLTQSILEDIIPGIKWKGDLPGMGSYSPVNEMICEHGHRYDLFNSTQPLVNKGHMLPPGYFISRLQAAGLYKTGGNPMNLKSGSGGGLLFTAGWIAAMAKVEGEFGINVDQDSNSIVMNGIDGYTAPFSYLSAFKLYAPTIESLWDSTQIYNEVPANIPVIWAILDGNDDLFEAAKYQYFTNGPKKYKIAVFGHTHQPMLEAYTSGGQEIGIYANSGSWVNENLSDYKVRTYLIIQPAAWTGSELDVVTLYQYNLDSGSGNSNPGYKAEKLDEESIQP